jgi:sugar-phosphatase
VPVTTVSAAGMLFDMDGVLVSSINSVNRCWRLWAKYYGVQVGADYEIPHGVRAVEVMEALDPRIDKVEGLKLIEDMEIEDVHDIITLPGALALTSSLPHERWSIVTSATHRLLVARLRAAGLPQPERIISADLVERGKPDPQPYLMGAERLGVSPKDCLVFEDAPSGVKSGVAAGARVVGILGTTPEATLRACGATWVVRSLEAVTAVPTADGLSVTIDAL